LGEHGLKVELTEAAREWLAQTGYNPDFGARPLQRVIQKHLESPLSLKILGGEFTSGDTVIVDVSEDEKDLVFSGKKGENQSKNVVEEVEVEA
jgi:ATP-dependent Clp protease ATP-binding subunit ClpA